jgi:hypothetical protein
VMFWRLSWQVGSAESLEPKAGGCSATGRTMPNAA